MVVVKFTARQIKPSSLVLRVKEGGFTIAQADGHDLCGDDMEDFAVRGPAKLGAGQTVEFYLADTSGAVPTAAKPMARLRL